MILNQLRIIRGDTQTYSVEMHDAAGAPLDLTGAQVWFSVRGLVTKTLDDGIAVASPLTGAATITLDPEDTQGAPRTRRAYDYDVQVKLADGTVKTPIRGLFIVMPDVTIETS